MDLMRTILLEIEEDEGLGGAIDIKAPDYTPDQVTYHVGLLKQAGLIEAADAGSLDGGPAFIPQGLTWNGHEFLDAVRNDTIWHQVKAEVNRLGSLPIELVKTLTIKVVAKHMGLP